MRRALLAVTLLAALPPALPAQFVTPPPTPPRGVRTYDIRNAVGGVPGALPGYYNATRTRRAIQAAIDANPADTGANHQVFIPSGDWYVDRPVMDDRHIDVVAEPGATLTGVGETTPWVKGVPRQGYVRSMPLAGQHLDGAGGAAFAGLYLDAGEHAFIPCSPFSHGLPPSIQAGTVDAYQATDEVTVEWQQDLGASALYAGPVMGMSNGLHATPWTLGYFSYGTAAPFFGVTAGGTGYTSAPTVTATQTGGGTPPTFTATVAGGAVTGLALTSPGLGIQPGATITLAFSGGGGAGAAGVCTPYFAPAGVAGGLQVCLATADGTKWGSTRRYYFGIPAGMAGKADFAVTMSPRQGVVACWVNGVRQGAFAQSPAMPTAGSKFAPNWDVALQIADEDVEFPGIFPAATLSNAPAGATGTTPLNRNFTGLRYWAGAPYVLTGSAGSAQTRVDGLGLDHGGSAGARYKTQEAGVIAWLPFTDAPADVLAYRQFTVMFGSGTTATPSVCGYVVSNGMVGHPDWQFGSVRNLTLKTQGKYAPGMILGYTIDYEVRDCAIAGGVNALYNLQTGATYTIKLAGFNQLVAADIPLSLEFATVEQSGQLSFTNYGRCCVYATTTSSLRFAYVYVVYPANPALYLFRVGNYLQLDRLMTDFEGDMAALTQFKAACYIDAGTGSPQGTSLRIGNYNGGNLPAQGVLAYIDESDGGGGAGRVEIGNISSFSNAFRAVVETNGKAARADLVESCDLLAPWVLNSTTDGTSGLRCTKPLDGLPRRGQYATHSSILEAVHPADGQFARFRCTAGGTYAAGAPATPPRWLGQQPLDDSGAALATYVQANPAWTSGNAVAAAGPAGELIASRFLNAYLGGAAAPAPAPALVACLITGPTGSMTEAVGEASGNGYARTAVAFGASASGVAGSSATLTFPTLTGPIGTVRALHLRGAANNLLYGVVPVDPIATQAGTVISFAAGSLTVRPVPVPAGGTLGPQMGYVGTQVYDDFHNYCLRDTAFTPPSGLQFALSTAPASTSPPTEPSGNGYARVNAGAFTLAPDPNAASIGRPGVTSNAAAITFATPTGSWGTIKSVYLLDGAGNVTFSGNVTIQRSVGSGSPAPAIPVGAFWVAW